MIVSCFQADLNGRVLGVDLEPQDDAPKWAESWKLELLWAFMPFGLSWTKLLYVACPPAQSVATPVQPHKIDVNTIALNKIDVNVCEIA